MVQKVLKIEQALSAWLRPTFMVVMEDPVDQSIHVVVSHGLFQLNTIPKRIEIVNKILYERCPEVFINTSIIIEAYDNDQMADLIDFSFEGV